MSSDSDFKRCEEEAKSLLGTIAEQCDDPAHTAAIVSLRDAMANNRINPYAVADAMGLGASGINAWEKSASSASSSSKQLVPDDDEDYDVDYDGYDDDYDY